MKYKITVLVDVDETGHHETVKVKKLLKDRIDIAIDYSSNFEDTTVNSIVVEDIE